MSVSLRILHLIYEPGRAEGLEVARAAAEYAADATEPLTIEAWAPKEVRPIPNVRNRAREEGVYHRGPHAMLALRSFLVNERVSIVHCHDRHAAVTMAMLKMTGRMPAVAYGVYGPLGEPRPGRPLSDAARRAFLWLIRRHMDAVIAPSAFARGVIISQGALHAESVHKVTYGVSCEGASTAESQGGQVGVMLLPVKMPHPRRRMSYYYFLQGAQVFLRQGMRASFILVPAAGDWPYVEALVDRFGVRSAVRAVRATDFPGCLSLCDVAVLPTGDFQGIRPLVLALAAGKAVVAPDLRGVREFVDPEVTGLLVRPSDSQALAQALARLVSGEAARRNLSRSARRAAERLFSARRMGRDLAEIYRRLTRTP